MYWIVVTEVKV